jgi:hypothetical protein
LKNRQKNSNFRRPELADGRIPNFHQFQSRPTKELVLSYSCVLPAPTHSTYTLIFSSTCQAPPTSLPPLPRSGWPRAAGVSSQRQADGLTPRPREGWRWERSNLVPASLHPQPPPFDDRQWWLQASGADLGRRAGGIELGGRQTILHRWTSLRAPTPTDTASSPCTVDRAPPPRVASTPRATTHCRPGAAS